MHFTSHPVAAGVAFSRLQCPQWSPSPLGSWVVALQSRAERVDVSKAKLLSLFIFFHCWSWWIHSKNTKCWLKSSRGPVLAPVQWSTSCNSSLDPSYIYRYCPHVMGKAFAERQGLRCIVWMLSESGFLITLTGCWAACFWGDVCRWRVGVAAHALQDTVVDHPHFYIQMQMKINVPGFNRSSTKLFKSFLKARAFLPWTLFIPSVF